jgi:hypothetical protein
MSSNELPGGASQSVMDAILPGRLEILLMRVFDGEASDDERVELMAWVEAEPRLARLGELRAALIDALTGAGPAFTFPVGHLGRRRTTLPGGPARSRVAARPDATIPADRSPTGALERRIDNGSGLISRPFSRWVTQRLRGRRIQRLPRVL